MDLVLKKHFDRHRSDNSVPEELEWKFEGHLFKDTEKLDTWRNNFRGLRYKDEKTGITLMGALDDLFVTSDGLYAPLDFKTRGFPRKENTHEYYQHQMDIYSFLLEKNSLPPAEFAILVFYHPIGVDEKHNVIFNPDTVKVPVDRNRGEKIFLDAAECVLGDKPEPSKDCAFCEWLDKRKNLESEKQKPQTQKDLSKF